MLDRLSTEERIVGGGAILAIASAYVTWFTYDSGNVQIGLNGFRASIFGDLFVIAAAASLILLASQLRLVKLSHGFDHDVALWITSLVCLGSFVAQAIFSLAQGQHIHLAAAIALLGSAAMVFGSRRQVRNPDVIF